MDVRWDVAVSLAQLFFQTNLIPAGGRTLHKNLTAQIIVDPDDIHAQMGKVAARLGAEQAC